jgi:ubiquinone/menaquinone biosynthesis C-methylase UbiE
MKGQIGMRDLKEESRRTFDGQAENYDKGVDGKHARAAYSIIVDVLKAAAPKTVMDLGCGTGALLEQVLKIEYIDAAYGLDLSEKMLEQARNKLTGATLIQGDSEHLPFEDDFFDVVYCNDSFHHYPNPKAVLSEVKRVLKRGGIFILCDPYQQPGALWLTNFILRLTNTGNVKLYSKKELCSLMAEHFSNIEWQNVGSTAHMVRGVKK